MKRLFMIMAIVLPLLGFSVSIDTGTESDNVVVSSEVADHFVVDNVDKPVVIKFTESPISDILSEAHGPDPNEITLERYLKKPIIMVARSQNKVDTLPRKTHQPNSRYLYYQNTSLWEYYSSRIRQ